MIVAIDGPAGSGKSTVARLVAERLGFRYIDTGAMYRAVAFRAMTLGITMSDEERIVRVALSDQVTFSHEPGESLPSRVYIGGDDVTAAIRLPRVDEAVSAVASMPGVRDAMVAQQRGLAAEDDVVMEGRDIGTVVFPDAAVKVYLTASPEERARRRAAQQASTGILVDPAGVREAIERRDTADSTRVAAPLVPAPDAVVIDTSDLTVDEVVETIARLVEQVRG